MLYFRIGVLLPLMGISREKVGTKTVPKFYLFSEHTKDLLLDTTVFENSILGSPPQFHSLQWGPRSPCSYSGVSWVFQFLRESAGCYNLVWQVSLLSANFIVLVTHLLPNPHPIS